MMSTDRRTRQRLALFNVLLEAEALTVMDCGDCGIVFGIPESYDNAKRRSAGGFMCPNGHHMRYRPDALERERARAEQAEAEATRLRQGLDEETREHRETEANRRRLLQRVRAGVCPHCKRYFQGLAAHVETKHPNEPLDAVLETQPVIHKQRHREPWLAGYWTACYRSVKPERASLRWDHVTCKQCLRHR